MTSHRSLKQWQRIVNNKKLVKSAKQVLFFYFVIYFSVEIARLIRSFVFCFYHYLFCPKGKRLAWQRLSRPGGGCGAWLPFQCKNSARASPSLDSNGVYPVLSARCCKLQSDGCLWFSTQFSFLHETATTHKERCHGSVCYHEISSR